MQIETDTIAALATPAGGAIGVIRLSGPEAIAITQKLIVSRKTRQHPDLASKMRYYGFLTDSEGNDIDDVLVSVFHGPHSYTGEDSTEISCHGSSFILQQALHALINAGARQAKPGEYTRRAYLNGKMDLSQAEAVADLVSASNRATHKLALSQLKGHFSSELSILRDQLLKMTSLLELELDFSDHEELEFADRTELKSLAEIIDKRITTLARSFETGNALKQGIPVAIIGKTNVGKSTLLNQLLHEEKAIVSDIDGTTRDVIEDTTQINGITFRFIDTAGIRKTDDKIEQMGIERAYQKLDEATIVIWVLDAMPSNAEIEEMAEKCEGKKLVIALNKSDLSEGDKLPENSELSPSRIQEECSKFDMQYSIQKLSAKFGEGISELEEKLYATADIPEINENSIIVTNARHYEALTKAHISITRVIEGMEMEMSGDLLAEDLNMCLEELGDITGGTINSEERLQNIFKHFCIGK